MLSFSIMGKKIDLRVRGLMEFDIALLREAHELLKIKRDRLYLTALK